MKLDPFAAAPTGMRLWLDFALWIGKGLEPSLSHFRAAPSPMLPGKTGYPDYGHRKGGLMSSLIHIPDFRIQPGQFGGA